MSAGIDIYTKYQTITDWHAVRHAGYEFAYVKVSDGDEDRPDNGWGPAGRASGVAMGAYHYAQPGDPVSQANRLCDRAIQAGMTDLAPALDIEDPFVRNQATVDFAVAFIRQVKARGFRPCLYSSNNMLLTIRGPVKIAVPETIIWAARYGAKPTVQYDLWQHADNGHVPGISASGVDLDQGIIPRNTGAMEADDLTPEQDSRQKFIENTLRGIVRLLTDDPEGDTPFEAANSNPGFPSFVDPKVRLTPLSALQLIDLHLVQALDKLSSAPAPVIGDDELAKIATAIIGALPASLAQGIVDEISARLEGK